MHSLLARARWFVAIASWTLVCLIVLIAARSAVAEEPTDGVELAQAAFQRSGASARFVAAEPDVIPAASALKQFAVKVPLGSEWAWAQCTVDRDGVDGVAVSVDRWELAALRWPPPYRECSVRASGPTAARLRAALAFLERASIRSAEVPPGGESPVPAFGRRVQIVPFGYQRESGEVSRGAASVLRAPECEEDARSSAIYSLLSEFVRSRATIAPARSAGPRVAAAVDHVIELLPSAAREAVDYWGLHGDRPSAAFEARLRSWADGAPADTYAREHLARALDGQRSSIDLNDASAVLATFAAGSGGQTARWRAHIRANGSPEEHAGLLRRRLRLSYPEAVDAAYAIAWFDYVPGRDAVEGAQAALPDVQVSIAESLLALGDEEGARALLERLRAGGGGHWDAEPAWWGGGRSLVPACDRLAQIEGRATSRKEWVDLIERTGDPFVAGYFLRHVKQRTEDDAARATRCITEAVVRPGCEIAVIVAIGREQDVMAREGRSCFDEAAVRKMRVAAQRVLDDPRVPLRTRDPIRQWLAARERSR